MQGELTEEDIMERLRKIYKRAKDKNLTVRCFGDEKSSEDTEFRAAMMSTSSELLMCFELVLFSAMAGQCRLQIWKGWNEVNNLWITVLLPSGRNKSAVSQFMWSIGR